MFSRAKNNHLKSIRRFVGWVSRGNKKKGGAQ